MKTISSLDQKVLNFKIEQVFDVISDFSTYSEWFPNSIKLEVLNSNKEKVGSLIKISIGIVSFQCELMRINKNKEIIVHYTGSYEGNGIWYFLETGKGTKLMYEIDLEIKNPIVKVLSLFVNVTGIHSKMMSNIFQGLEQYLNKIYNGDSDSLDNLSNTQPKIFSISSN